MRTVEITNDMIEQIKNLTLFNIEIDNIHRFHYKNELKITFKNKRLEIYIEIKNKDLYNIEIYGLVDPSSLTNIQLIINYLKNILK